MRFDTRRTTTLATVVTVVAVLVVMLLVTAGPVGAKKPVKPPPEPPPPVDGGTVYCCADGFTMKMNPDGTGQTALATSLRWFAEPSIDLHGGRWFLQVDPVPNRTYPDGRPRLELFAIHESGSPVVQLTDGRIDASNFIEPNNQGYPVEDGRRGFARWTDGDTKVSYMALRTVYDSQGNRTIQVGGLYALAVNPSNLPSHVATAMSGNPILPRPVMPIAYPCLWNPHYDWNPAGTAVVYWVPNDQAQARGFWIAHATDGFSNPVLLTASSGADPRWSPDGTRILFNGGLATGVKSIRVDGTDERLVIEDPDDKKKTQRWVEYAFWSPGSTHIVYGYRGSPSSVMRATAAGGDRAGLVEGWYYPRWRE